MNKVDTLRSVGGFARTFALTAALAVSGTVLAADLDAQQQRQRPGVEQQQRDPAQRIEQRVSLLTERLQLTPQQAQQVRTILTREHEQFQALRSSATGQESQDRQAARERIRAVREASEQQINAVLTPQQRTSYEALRQEFQNRRGGERGERKPVRPAAGATR